MRSQAESWLSERLAPGSGLPYPGQERRRIIEQLTDLTQEFSSLTVKTQTYTYNNGSSTLLLTITGTLPMYYAGAKYNIPVRLWLPEKFPYSGPLVFVEPTPEMMIMQNHPFVNANGAVSTDYLRQWGRGSALVDLCQDTMIGFGQSPPLYARPPGSARPPVHSPQEPASSSFSAHNPIHRPSQYSNSTPSPTRDQSPWGGAVAVAQGQRPPSFSPAARPEPPPQIQPQAAQETLEAAARQALTCRLQESLKLAHASAASKMDELLATQRELQSRSQALQAGVHSMQRERVALEQSTNELNGRAKALDRWLSANESKMPPGEVSADDAVVPADALSAQALAAQAEDLALEDAMYELDRALPESTQPIEVYLKQIRSLCRKQFFARALGNKVAARQHEQQGSASAQHSRPAPAVQMPQGDSWTNPGVLGGGYMGGFSNPLSQHR